MSGAALEAAYARALAHEKAGRAEAAAQAWREVLALDPEDRGGAALRLAALGAEAAPERAPPAHVAELFDQHAERFDEILVERLGYRAPSMLADMLRAAAPYREGGRIGRLLDLGCGTGLMGLALNDLADFSAGVDLSENMLAAADARGVHDELYVGDIVGFLEAAEPGEPPWDVIAAADVLPYLGDLAPLFTAAAAALAPGGRLLLSTETTPRRAPEPPGGWMVGRRQRFLHGEAYVRDALAAAGFVVEDMRRTIIRYSEGRPEPGHLVLARLRGGGETP